MGRAAEVRAAGELAAHAVGETVAIVGDMHQAITRRMERFLPRPARTVTRAHGAAVAATYRAVDQVATTAVRAGAEVAARRAGRPPSQTPFGRAVQPMLNGVWGDTVAQRGPALAVPMAVRVAGRDVPLDAGSLNAAFPQATGRIVVFVHGLVESDESWWTAPESMPDSTPNSMPSSFGHRLREEAALTPVYLRYNSGLALGENAHALARLIEELSAAWPQSVRRIDLVAHSMGGLIAHQACWLGARSAAAWVDAVHTVIGLGTPHLGAPLAKSVPVAEWALTRSPVSAPIARVLTGRSAGIRDLHHGALPPTLPGHITYRAIAALLTRNPGHPAGWLVGDGMVRPSSALVAGRGHRLGGVSHQGLLGHPDVYDRLRDWLA